MQELTHRRCVHNGMIEREDNIRALIRCAVEIRATEQRADRSINSFGKFNFSDIDPVIGIPAWQKIKRESWLHQLCKIIGPLFMEKTGAEKRMTVLQNL